ncbi:MULTISPECIES: hypothetical protein [Pseudofrankia]|uniref:hypothetical protein n=1 Tax=Pseudofrankia TaxID=2994363 RepID=UPI000234D41A|nr:MULTISPECIES: hypothetical protein [Pseudofrankia]OHV28127.1 hypothetical protein BCD49_06890 [Pseudofrankia sp. EUN1h]
MGGSAGTAYTREHHVGIKAAALFVAYTAALTLAGLIIHGIHTAADWVIAPAIAYGVMTIYLVWEDYRARQERRKVARAAYSASLSNQLPSVARRQ